MFVKTKKKKRQTKTNKHITIDSLHNKHMDTFSKDSENILAYEQKCVALRDDSNRAEEYTFYNDKILALRKKQDQYFLDTGHLLFDYYEKKNSAKKKNTIPKTNSTVLNYFTGKEQKDEITPQEGTTSHKSLSCIIHEYNKIVAPELMTVNKCDQVSDICSKCNINRILANSDCYLICPRCGTQEYILLNKDKPSYKEPPRENNHFAYKRLNHFNEWLSQFQAKESTNIPDIVMTKIKDEIKKERLDKITPGKIRGYLKKHGFNKFYEHTPHILTKLTGTPPPILSRQKEEKLRTMFKQIQIPFMLYCPQKRKNFLSYSYVLYKFTELLGMDELTHCFPLLKSRNKLYQQDIIWEQICKHLKWEFIKSI